MLFLNLSCRMPKCRTLAIAALFVSGVTVLRAQPVSNAILLNGNVTILVDARQPAPVRHAAEDLASDMRKVFGKAPRIIARTQDAGPVVIVLGDEAAGAPADHASTPEAFSITSGTATLDDARKVQLIRLAGADMRGTIYAIYQFSQDVLGVDPMYYWTDHEPTRQIAIHLPANLDRRFAPPVFRYRGFFINDEDLLTGWASGEAKDHTGIALDVWNKIFETILRLKGNMVVAGSWPFANEPQDHLVAERGLLLNQHHATPLGVNFSRWPADVPYNLTQYPQYIENAWKNAVAAYPVNQQILWEVGLRGLSDQAYADLDPAVRNNPKAQGKIISKAIADQIAIVRAKHPDAVFITDLWMEGAQLMRSGDLVIPPYVITVWPDTGYGDMQDHGQVRAGDGAYIHVAMENSYANQLSELTPVDRLFASLGRFQNAQATSFLLVNTSDIRPVTMGASAVLDFGWQGQAIGSSDTFYDQWSKEEFGDKAAASVAAVYKAYFQAPADPDKTSRPYGDNYYHTIARQLLRDAMVQWPTYTLLGQSPFWVKPSPHPVPFDPSQVAQQIDKEIAACGEAEPRWEAVWKQALAAQTLVNPDRRTFYQAGVLTMIAINRESNRMLLDVALAVQALQKNDHAEALSKAMQALEAIDDIKTEEHKAEYGKWKNWYHGDWLTGVDRTRQLIQNFIDFLKDPNTPIPPPIEMSNWEAYYYIQHYQGTRQVDVRDTPTP
jgi:hypothetical protein